MRAENICHYNDQLISVTRAKEIRDHLSNAERKASFRCIHCGGFVKPLLGTTDPPRFEHWPGQNDECPVGHIRRGIARRINQVMRDFDDPSTIEGTKKDVQHQVSARDRTLAQECKQRANYACQACDFKLKVGTRYVLDAHHRYPLSLGERTTLPEDLVALCPTCHRIAHTADFPLDHEAIRALRGMHQPT